jgi:hypothetical protein
MSAYRQMTTVMNDQQILCQQLQKRFSKVENHSTPQPMARWGRDKEERAEIIVRKKDIGGHAFNDIGFKRDANRNFTAVISDIDDRRFDQKWLNELARDYMEAKATQTMTENECELEERTVLPNGAIQLRYRVAA